MTFLIHLLMPPGLLVTLLLLGLVLALGHKRWRRRYLGLSFVCGLLLYLLSLNVVALPLLVALQKDAPAPSGATPQAVVILSAGVYESTPEHPREEIGGLTLERLYQGAVLARQQDLPILVTGGVAKNFTLSRASLMNRALNEGFGLSARWQEDRSTTTFENALYSAPLLQAAGITRIYLVSHGWHLPRAREAFEAQGLEVTPVAVGMLALSWSEPSDYLPRGKALQQSDYALHEWLGRLWYQLAYY
ncbi:hypothetical protein JCM17960_31310 [Magnetospira thiophila]